MPTLGVFVCYLLAVICFVVAAFRSNTLDLGALKVGNPGLIALGLAFAVLPHLWNAAEAIGD